MEARPSAFPSDMKREKARGKRISAFLSCFYTAVIPLNVHIRPQSAPVLAVRRVHKPAARRGKAGEQPAPGYKEPPRYPHGRRGGDASDKTNSKARNGKRRQPIGELQLSYTQSDYTTKAILRMKNILCAFNTAPRSARLRLGGIKARGGAFRLSSGGLPPLAAADLCTAKIGIKRLSAK